MEEVTKGQRIISVIALSWLVTYKMESCLWNGYNDIQHQPGTSTGFQLVQKGA